MFVLVSFFADKVFDKIDLVLVDEVGLNQFEPENFGERFANFFVGGVAYELLVVLHEANRISFVETRVGRDGVSELVVGGNFVVSVVE